MKILRIGDPHVTVSNLKDSAKLIDFIIEMAKKHAVEQIEFLGDLFHTHAIKRVEVEDFWMKSFKKISKEACIPIISLVGNHDMIGSKEKEQEMNSLNIFNNIDGITIVNKPMILNNIAYIPYTSDLEKFVNDARDLYDQGAQKLLMAHQTFTGLTYDNGFYAEDGIEPELILQDQIISGHIHTQQVIGKCTYPGSPKWDFMTDANIEKGIWVFSHNDDGAVKDKQFISTKGVVTPINKYTVKEGEEVPELDPNSKNYIEFYGKTAWINKMKKKYKGIANIKGKPIDRRVIKSEIDRNLTLLEYLNKEFKPVKGVGKRDIDEYLKTI